MNYNDPLIQSTEVVQWRHDNIIHTVNPLRKGIKSSNIYQKVC